MSEIVFILGAGASVSAGAPTMDNFRKTAQDFLKEDKFGQHKEKIKLVLDAIAGLQGITTKSRYNLWNIENLFSAFEMAKIINKLPGGDIKTIDDLLDAMNTFISKTLEYSVLFPFDQDKLFPVPHNDYRNFVSLIRGLHNKSRPNDSRCSIITFNYDIALDFALHRDAINIDYGFSGVREGSPSHKVIPLLKLHGSTNWARCEECDTINPWMFDGIFFRRTQDHEENPKRMLDTPFHIMTCTECDSNVKKKSLIVPPTWNKFEKYKRIAGIWRRAVLELEEAEAIVVIGYSFPKTDQFFGPLLSLGTHSSTMLDKFIVYNPDNDHLENAKLYAGDSVRIKEFFQIPFDRSMDGNEHSISNQLKR